MNDEIYVVAELSDGRILPATHETLAFARGLAAIDPISIRMILPHTDKSSSARELAQKTGLDVIVLAGPDLESYNAEVWVSALASLLAERKPRYVCIPHTSRGCDFAPGLAIRMGAACITAVEGVRRCQGAVCFTRSIFNGKIGMNLVLQTDCAVLTVLPGTFDTQKLSEEYPLCSPAPGTTPHESSEALVEVFPAAARARRIRTLAVIPEMDSDLELTLADVIVSAGRGIGTEEGIEWIRHLAGLFSKSAVGCSRALCDLGWLDYKHQVGLTGKTVAPKLYMACGISGAVQHVAGMRTSKTIVAVNKDPQAAIFRVADIGIVEDLTTFIPLLLETVRDRNLL
jgi:electron transfer flavoprotein alpha subunit